MEYDFKKDGIIIWILWKNLKTVQRQVKKKLILDIRTISKIGTCHTNGISNNKLKCLECLLKKEVAGL